MNRRSSRPEAPPLRPRVAATELARVDFHELVPEAESHQFQQSSAIAAATGLLVIFTLSHLAR